MRPVSQLSGHAAKALRLAGSSHVTATIFVLGIAILFFTSLAEATHGRELAVQAFIGSLLASWTYPAHWPLGEWLGGLWIMLPGGPVIGAAALINLGAAGLLRLGQLRRKPRSMAGLAIIHAGLLLVLGAYFTPILRLGNGFTLASIGSAISIIGLLIHYLAGGKAKATAPAKALPDCGKAMQMAIRALPLAGLLAPALLCLPLGKAAANLFGGAFILGSLIPLSAMLLLLSALVSFGRHYPEQPIRLIVLATLALVSGLSGSALMAVVIHFERPPVTELRSVLLLVGWACALTTLHVEKRRLDGLAALAGASAILVTLSFAGLMTASEAPNPAIDQRHWLILHVFVIACGYAAMLMAVLFANVRLAGALCGMDADKGRGIERICARALSSGVILVCIGTFTGGLWATMAWGRFWGWDPKENAALMLILWAMLAIHCRRTGLMQGPGYVATVALTGPVLLWSWAGTNLLGTGLHSYGFADGAALWLCAAYLAAQLALAVAGRKRMKNDGA